MRPTPSPTSPVTLTTPPPAALVVDAAAAPRRRSRGRSAHAATRKPWAQRLGFVLALVLLGAAFVGAWAFGVWVVAQPIP